MRRASVMWQYSSARVVAHFEREMVYSHVTGLVTPSVAKQVMHDNATYVAITGARGQIVDYSQATLAFTRESLHRHAELSAKAYDLIFDVPAALIVNPEQFELLCEYSALMSQHGIFRAPHLTVEAAQQWLTERMASLVSMPRGSDPPALQAGGSSPPHQEQSQTDEPGCEQQR